MKKIRILLLILAAAGCMECTGCSAGKPASEQGELVRNERLSEKNPAVFLNVRLYV